MGKERGRRKLGTPQKKHYEGSRERRGSPESAVKKRRKKRIKRRKRQAGLYRILLGIVLVILGAGFFLYPNFREWRTRQEVRQIMKDFDKAFSEGLRTEASNGDAKKTPDTSGTEDVNPGTTETSGSGEDSTGGTVATDGTGTPKPAPEIDDVVEPSTTQAIIPPVINPQGAVSPEGTENIQQTDNQQEENPQVDNPQADNPQADNPDEEEEPTEEENASVGSIWRDGERPYQDLYDTMKTYNENLAENGQRIVDAWSYEQEPFDLSDWPFLGTTPTIGYIDIPDMGIVLPLFLGASPENLEKGAAVLSQTSMPIGGESTNCVIAGHRGWEGSAYFQYVENMRLGSRVYVTNPWETLVYECTEIQITYPDQVKPVLIRPGKDMITLFTCHPYMFGGGPYRYLVFCERVDTQERKEAEMENPKAEPPAKETESVDLGVVGTVASTYSDLQVNTPAGPDLHVDAQQSGNAEEDISVRQDITPEAAITDTPDSIPDVSIPAGDDVRDEEQDEKPEATPEVSPIPISAPPGYSDGGFDLLTFEHALRFALPAALIVMTILMLLLRAIQNSRARKRRRRKKTSGRDRKRKGSRTSGGTAGKRK